MADFLLHRECSLQSWPQQLHEVLAREPMQLSRATLGQAVWYLEIYLHWALPTSEVGMARTWSVRVPSWSSLCLLVLRRFDIWIRSVDIYRDICSYFTDAH